MPVVQAKKIFLSLLFSGVFIFAKAQQTDTSIFFRKWKTIGDQATINSIEKYKAGRIAMRQQFLIDEIRSTSARAKNYLKKGIDSISILNTLRNTNQSLAIVNEGTFLNKSSFQSQRNLAVSFAILSELLSRMTNGRNTVSTYTHDLVNFRDRIDSLSMDSALYTFPNDSVSIVRYLERLRVMKKEIDPVDSALNQSLFNIQELSNKTEVSVLMLRSALEETERYRVELNASTFNREFQGVFEPVPFTRPFHEILQLSLEKERLALSFYLTDNKLRFFVLVILLVVIFAFIRTLKKHIVEHHALQADYKNQLVLRKPILSAIILSTCLFQFIFLDPPFIFSFILWLVAAICLAILFRGFITAWWMRFWLVMIFLFTLSGFDNMILQPSAGERFFMLTLSLTGMLFSLYALIRGRKSDLKEKGILYFIGFVVVMEFLATLFNFYGRYNFSKTLLISGYSGLIIAILFLWTVRFINEILGISNMVYKHPDKNLFFINFNRIGEKAPVILYVFLVLGWFILVCRNSYAFKEIVTPFNDFLTRDRILGDYSFSINGLFIFLLILFVSMILSRIISFFASEPGDKNMQDNSSGKVELGSWLLLIRIFIISTGVFLAFAASGIPLDKITIILGALGVGIGLGLQDLVNNLVSGLIIAFEKPVNVGDSIEVNGKPGTMKSIGFRSSVVTMADGAFLIIPNGDLLSQHLVNWSMGKQLKRLSVVVGVAYGSDLARVKQIITTLLDAEPLILNNPPPRIIANEFASSSIEFELLFWVKLSSDSKQVRSNVITNIESNFKTEGIDIPIPKQEIYIYPNSGTGSV